MKDFSSIGSFLPVLSVLLLFPVLQIFAQDVRRQKLLSDADTAWMPELSFLLDTAGRVDINKIKGSSSLRIDSFFSSFSKNTIVKFPDKQSIQHQLGIENDKSGNHASARKAFRVMDGYAGYQYNFQSNIDTPFVERNIGQHNLTGQLNFVIADAIPLQARYWVRKSNSNIFRDIADVQVVFNAAAFRQKLQSGIQQKMHKLANGLKDSITEKLYLHNLNRLNMLRNLQQRFSPQDIAEAREILRIPRITYNPYLTDSVNAVREDSIRKVAAFLLEFYDKVESLKDSLTTNVDSLKQVYNKNLRQLQSVQGLISKGWKNYADMNSLQSKLEAAGVKEPEIAAKYKWLLGVRNFSIGRSVTSYSDLTAKNISVNGLNFEYNSWYYLALTAGTVNYRFRDFALNGIKRKPQYLFLARVGIGSIGKNYFILSAYRGQKQLFVSADGKNSSISITGLSAEAKWQVSPYSYLTVELAQSAAPDLRNNPARENHAFNLSDKSSQAIAVRVYNYFPSTRSRLEGYYRNSGANFQSFTSFQTNAAQESWYIKAEQRLFKSKLSLNGSLRKNEFTNPFIQQQYKSNTVFKSFSASFRMRKWPVITAGYQPISQLTKLDNQLIEYRFQSLNATLYHYYRMKNIHTASTVMINRFYNGQGDTAFVYRNATNVYGSQNFFFTSFTASIAASHTSNNMYMLNVMDVCIEPRFKKLGTVGFGVKINDMKNDRIALGGYLRANIHITGKDMLYVSYEHNYLPGHAGRLVRNEMAGIQFIKQFSFSK